MKESAAFIQKTSSVAKPVFIIKYPNWVSMAEIAETRKSIVSGMQDYHLLFVPIENKDFQFECYNSEDANDIDFKLLQQRVIELTKSAVNKVEETNY